MKDIEFLEAMVAGFARQFASPSPECPTVRCVTRPRLKRILGHIRDNVRPNAHKRWTGDRLIRHLEQSQLVAGVPLEWAAQKIGLHRFLSIGFDGEVRDLHPIELLQANEPEGVICYFTALEVHELVTQVAPHHHIAKARAKDVGRATNPASGGASVEGVVGPSDRAAPIGSRQFEYSGVAYYLTLREDRYLAEPQFRYLSEKSQFRVTTLEQTLLDSLHRPMACGGPAVVFEAWDSAIERVAADRILELLRGLADEALTRRAGYMLTRIGMSHVAPEIADLLSEFRFAAAAAFRPPYSLFQGIPYTRLDKQWGLLVP